MQQTDIAWIAAGRRTAVIAAPGYWGSWTDRVARAYIVAAQRAGADAVEVPCVAAPAMARYAAEYGLRLVAHVDTPADPDVVVRAAGAGIEIFHADSEALADGMLAEALGGRVHCLLVSVESASAGWPGEAAVRGVCAIPIYPSGNFAKRMRPAMRRLDGPFGCETTARQPVPASVMGVMAAVAGAAVIRQHLALARYFGRADAAHFLTHRDFREMVQNLRSAERIIEGYRPQAAGGRVLSPRPGWAGLTAPESPSTTESSSSPSTTESPVWRLPSDAVSVTAASEVLKPAVHGRFFASELVAGVTATIDLTGCPTVATHDVATLIARLKRSRTLDSITALVAAERSEKGDRSQEPGEPPSSLPTPSSCLCDPASLSEMMAGERIQCVPRGPSWLAGMLELAGVHSADVLVWIPASHVLADPAIIDRMVVQHVKSNADYTFCQDLPAGLAPRLMSVAALRRIGAFTGNHADGETAARLLSNRRAFRVQELLVEERLRRPELDLRWSSGRELLLRRIARTGAESAAELIARAEKYHRRPPAPREPSSVSLACSPLCLYTMVTHGDDPSASF